MSASSFHLVGARLCTCLYDTEIAALFVANGARMDIEGHDGKIALQYGSEATGPCLSKFTCSATCRGPVYPASVKDIVVWFIHSLCDDCHRRLVWTSCVGRPSRTNLILMQQFAAPLKVIHPRIMQTYWRKGTVDHLWQVLLWKE